MTEETLKEIVEKVTLFNNIGLFALLGILLAFIGSMFSIFYSYKSSKKSNDVASNLGHLSASTQDKQRIIQTIGVQRIEWINDLRRLFVEFNDAIHTFQFDIASEDLFPPEYFTNKYLSISKITNNIELYLNTEETYSSKLVIYMEQIEDDIMQDKYEEVKRKRELIGFMQQIILKSEWKRIKEETFLGKELSSIRMREIVNEVGTSWNEILHRQINE